MIKVGQWPSLLLILLLAACADAPPPPAGTDNESAQQVPPFAVGSSTVFIHDPSRPYDSVAGVNSGMRSLVTEIWYPVQRQQVAAADAQYRRATYGDYVFGNRAMHRLMMTKTTFFHLTPETVNEGVSAQQIDAAIDELFLRQRQSYVDAPLAATAAPLPVVVMSHGDAGSRYNMESVCELLAANGYLVIAAEHTGNSPYSMTGSDPALAAEGGDPAFRAAMSEVLPLLNEHGAYGSEDNYGQSYSPLSASDDPLQKLVALDQALLQRLHDLRAVLDELAQMNVSGRFAGRLALDRIGLVGRSFGGATTLVGLAMEERFSAGFAVVPPGWTDQRESVPAEMLVPAGQESVLLSAERESPFTTLSKPTFLLSGAEDSLIIGLAAGQAQAGGVLPTAGNPHPALYQAYQASSQPVIWGLLAESNHASFGVSGGYWWPQLKPATQQRHFAPGTDFRLIAPALAHQMQQEKALAFFDYTIRGDLSARSRLLDQKYRSQGLSLEARNL